ncbi:MAG: ABC transporter permease [Clostridiales bacterium]|nr:ABC transporter permease [Clostridiales bacterium]
MSKEQRTGDRLEGVNSTGSSILKRITHDRVMLLLCMLGILVVLMSVLYPYSFPTKANIVSVLLDTAQLGILTTGMMCLLISGVFDISIGATLAFGGIISGMMVKLWGLHPVIAIIGGLLAGTLVGFGNGFIVTRLRVNAMIATLATQYIIRGVILIIAPSGVSNLPENFKPFGQTMILGLQSPFWVMAIVVCLLWFLMEKTRFFRQLYYIGAKSKAAKLSGIKVERLVMINFVIMGSLAGLCGSVLASRLSNAVVLAGTGVEMKTIAAAILGGASLTGGVGKVPGAFLGALLMSVIQNVLIICKVPVSYQSIIVGLILVLALGLDQMGKAKD